MKNGKLVDLIAPYLATEGKKSVLNPTIRSKIIYGVAATMSRLHKKHILQNYLIDNIFLDDKLEPRINLSKYSYIISEYEEVYYDGMCHPKKFFSPEYFNNNDGVSFPSDVFEFAFFIYAMFGGDFTYKKWNLIKYVDFISRSRPPKPRNMPKHYWELIERCWKEDPDNRPTFSDITEILKNDEFAIEEFGMKTDLEQLHEYQRRIANNFSPTDQISKEKVFKNDHIDERKILKENEEMKNKIEKYESILLPKPPHQKDDSNFFIGEEDEEFFTNLGVVGEGGTFITYKLIDTRNKNQICKKVIKYKKDQTTIKDAQNVLKEFHFLHEMNHPCICKAIGINTSEKLEIVVNGETKEVTTISLFLEFLEYGLNDVLQMKINNTMKAKIVVDVVHAMNHIHKKGIMHRDLKIDNIMLNSIFETKLVDFGLVKINENTLNNYSFVKDSLTKGVGTLAYMSPEMINEDDYDFKTDVYSFGVVLYVMFVGSLPKQNMKDKSNGKKITLPKPSSSISDFCIMLISKCLEPDPKNRPSFEDILLDLRKNAYELASDVNPLIISRRDNELDLVEKIQ
ncbi:hypothetical protein M9Y10_019479 [Tritrichomonas musculus]|uniref:Protein kinase domain-containing protein n=1 Tax=Tritrichomonas musculus TaxID=1915356 RepID=A0ABR2HGK1_9EUKA